MNSRFLAQHFTVNISKFQLPRKGVKSQLSRSSCMYMITLLYYITHYLNTVLVIYLTNIVLHGERCGAHQHQLAKTVA